MTFGAIWKILKDIVHIAVLLSWLGLLAIWLAFHEDMDDLEGNLFPVTTGTTIIDSKPSSDGKKTHLRLEFIKVRRCDPEEVIVIRFLLSDNSQNLIGNRWPGQDEGRLVSRDLGLNRTDWWEVDVPWETAKTDQFQIDVVHECHGWWGTRTTMYIGTLVREQRHEVGRRDFP